MQFRELNHYGDTRGDLLRGSKAGATEVGGWVTGVKNRYSASVPYEKRGEVFYRYSVKHTVVFAFLSSLW